MNPLFMLPMLVVERKMNTIKKLGERDNAHEKSPKDVHKPSQIAHPKIDGEEWLKLVQTKYYFG